MDTENNKAVFIHIPKTAGTSIRHIVDKSFKRREICHIYGKEGISFENFLELSDQEKKKFKIFFGHISFVQDLIPGNKTLYFTMLREPIQRTISHYQHAMRYHDKWKNNPVSLLRYLDSKKYSINNMQTRIISGIKKAPADRELLGKAIFNIDNYFTSIGLTERFEESIENFSEHIELKTKYRSVRKNETRDKQNNEYYSERELNAVRKLNRLDIQIYEYVQNKFFK